MRWRRNVWGAKVLHQATRRARKAVDSKSLIVWGFCLGTSRKPAWVLGVATPVNCMEIKGTPEMVFMT